MATTFTRKKLASQPQFGGTPYGNLAVLAFNVTTNASGVWTDGDGAAAPAATDELIVGILPAGMLVHDALMIVSDAFTAVTTAKVGIRAVDGVTTQDDADYFTASLVTNAVGRYRADNTAVAPIKLARDMYVVLDWDGATNAVAGVIDVLVYGVLTGAP